MNNKKAGPYGPAFLLFSVTRCLYNVKRRKNIHRNLVPGKYIRQTNVSLYMSSSFLQNFHRVVCRFQRFLLFAFLLSFLSVFLGFWFLPYFYPVHFFIQRYAV